MRCHFAGSNVQLERKLRLEQVAKVISVITSPG